MIEALLGPVLGPHGLGCPPFHDPAQRISRRISQIRLLIMTQRPVWAVIMAGGGGTRLWPASRRSHPKQLLRLCGERSLLQSTWDRLEGLVEPERTLVVTGASQADGVRAQLPDLPPNNLLAEPEGRNTLPCIAWAAAEIAQPGTRLATDRAAGRPCHRTGRSVSGHPARRLGSGARAQPIGHLGYPAHLPGHGLRLCGNRPEPSARPWDKRSCRCSALWRSRIARRPRPSWSKATFTGTVAPSCGTAPRSESALEAHAPATWEALRNADRDQVARVYPQLESISIDHGLMEKASGLVLLPIGYLWNDVGSWPALEEVLPGDQQDNRVGGGAELIAQGRRPEHRLCPRRPHRIAGGGRGTCGGPGRQCDPDLPQRPGPRGPGFGRTPAHRTPRPVVTNQEVPSRMTQRVGSVIAIDHGDKRTGLAVTDALRITIEPLAPFHGAGDGEGLLHHLAEVGRRAQSGRLGDRPTAPRRWP